VFKPSGDFQQRITFWKAEQHSETRLPSREDIERREDRVVAIMIELLRLPVGGFDEEA